MSVRVLRSHRVFGSRGRGGSIGWRERRRRVDRIARRSPQHRQDGRWANVPEDRLPPAKFTITPESCWGQPGGYSDDLACAVSRPGSEERDAA